MSRRAAFVAALLVPALAAVAQTTRAASPLVLPRQAWKVPANNDYDDPASEYCRARSVESDHVALFWAKAYGDEPARNRDAKLRFDPRAAVDECERFYACYADALGFADATARRQKLIVYVFSGDDGTAYGGGAENRIGIVWTPAVRIARPPFGALAHEMGHSFQYLLAADGHPGPAGGPIHEMTSQWMLWQVYPRWQTFERYHLDAFLKQTHLAFGHEENQYHSPYLLEYWAFKHGQSFVGQLWRDARRGEDAVAAYQRITKIDQSTFNDEVFDAARRFVTWDLPRIDADAARYANRHTCELRDAGDGWYEIAPSRCPQNYGYDAIRLAVPAAGTRVALDFKGVAGAAGFRSVRVDQAGWRYGFLAVRADGGRVYGPICSDANGETSFVVPDGTAFLWLVVSGAPKTHRPHAADGKPENDEQWPYRVRLAGATLDRSVAVSRTAP